ncbi:hypothetical protein GM3709_3209 [Geminocystis sp. NIES-3709]|nr:hypothetical protein GM3709_3209 [Geminocystis sp. NIES-3709]
MEILVHLDAIATLYQRDNGRFHIVLNNVEFSKITDDTNFYFPTEEGEESQKNLIWLEISPFRVIMTQQSKNGVNYRHYWEKGIYGKTRYWLNDNEEGEKPSNSIYLHNFTRNFTLKGKSIPESLRIEYELWSNRLNLGHYVLHLEVN